MKLLMLMMLLLLMLLLLMLLLLLVHHPKRGKQFILQLFNKSPKFFGSTFVSISCQKKNLLIWKFCA